MNTVKPPRGFWFGILVLLVLLFPTRTCFPQDQYTQVEFGGEFSTIRQTPDGGGGKNFPGFGARLDWNFNRRLALESEVDYFPEHAASEFLTQGGQTFQAVFGLRAKIIETHRLSVFGLIRPGLLHFNSVYNYRSQTIAPTYFELNLGGGLEYYISPRWVVRADIAGNPYRVANETSVDANGGPSLVIGKIEDTTRLSFGVAYRPGELRDNPPETPVTGRAEFGPLFSTMISVREGTLNGVRTDLGAGGFVSYRLWGVFYLDSDVLFFPQSRSTGGPHNGDEILQGLFGVKGGIRRNQYGFFGKIRPGFNSDSQAVIRSTKQGDGTPAYTYGRSTNLVLDLGGIVEFYPSERSTLRLEAGDTHIFYRDRTVDGQGVPTAYAGSGLKHSIEFIVGYGWRF